MRPTLRAKMSTERKRIGFLGYQGIMALDLIGPLDAFATAVTTDGEGKPRRCYDVVIIGLNRKPFVSESGATFIPTETVGTARALDTLVIPGGSGLRRPEINRQVTAWVKSREKSTRRIVSVCTGVYGLASTGLLDGKTVTTHWRFARDVVNRFPKLTLNDNVLFVRDGKFSTSAGITAGIDLSLALIEEDFGRQVALAVARELVVYLKRPGGQEQYSEPLRHQVETMDRFGELVVWMRAHLKRELTVEALARRASLSVRQFNRRFKHACGSTPGAFVEGLRLNEARERLLLPEATVANVAESVGFQSADVFRRAFERRFGIGPGTYGRRFERLSS